MLWRTGTNLNNYSFHQRCIQQHGTKGEGDRRVREVSPNRHDVPQELPLPSKSTDNRPPTTLKVRVSSSPDPPRVSSVEHFEETRGGSGEQEETARMLAAGTTSWRENIQTLNVYIAEEKKKISRPEQKKRRNNNNKRREFSDPPPSVEHFEETRGGSGEPCDQTTDTCPHRTVRRIPTAHPVIPLTETATL